MAKAKTKEKEKKPAFPKISATGGIIKQRTKKKGCVDLRFDKINFKGQDSATLDGWIDNEDKITLTIEQDQANLDETF